MKVKLMSKEQRRRTELARAARRLFFDVFPVEESDETSLMMSYGDFYLQVSYSELHPLMVLYLARTLKAPFTSDQVHTLNELNLTSVLGCHMLNNQVGCYSYRAVHWLDTELTRPRLKEILERCADEARRAYDRLVFR